ncbi:MAG: chemotaxis protein CheD [bacterium]|jgi:chemotaxis protein CheD
MQIVVVGIADCQVSNDPECTLATYALGSCIAVAIWDPVVRVGGLLHYMLPDSGIDGVKSRERPYMFADTGIPLLFRRAYEYGAQKHRMLVRVAGGAQVMDDNGVFDIGKRNYLALRRILWKAGVLIHAEDVGGTESRSLRLEVPTGALWLRTAGGAEREMAVSRAARKA